MSTPKLTAQQDAQIVDELANSDVTKADLARMYGVSPRSIGRAVERHNALASSNLTNPESATQMPITLSPGDCVEFTSDMSLTDIENICAAFVGAGAAVYDMGVIDEILDEIDHGEYIGWDARDGELYSYYDMDLGVDDGSDTIFTRLLTIEDVIGATAAPTQTFHAKEEEEEEEITPTYSFMMSDSSITIWADEEQETANKTHPEFQTITDLIYESRGSQEALDMAFKEISKKAQLKVLTRGKIEIDALNGVVTYMGHKIPLELTDRIIKAAQSEDESGLNALVEFTKRMYQNPYTSVISELYSFLEASDIEIDADGYVIAYKRVRQNYTDIHSGKFDNSPGAVCEMPRAFVDNDSNRTCSAGLHVCSQAYLPFFGSSSNGRIVQVKIDPADFVSIPNEYWGLDRDGQVKAKARVCKYEVLADVSEDLASRGL